MKKGLIVANQGIVLSSIAQQMFSDKEAQKAKIKLEKVYGESVDWAVTDYERLQTQLKEDHVSFIFLCSMTKQFKKTIIDLIANTDTQIIDEI